MHFKTSVRRNHGHFAQIIDGVAFEFGKFTANRHADLRAAPFEFVVALLFVRVYVRASACVCVCVCVCWRLCMYVSMCVYVRTHVCVWHDPLGTRK